jgi:hypothetical protein
VFKRLFDANEGKPVENPKKSSNDAIKTLFESILPDYDKDAVYVSDMKKVFSWYNLLLEKEMLDFTETTEEVAEKSESAEESAVEEK